MSEQFAEKPYNDEDQLDVLREILLRRDRKGLNELKETIEEKDRLKEKVNPIIEDQIQFIKSNFPEVFGKEVDMAIERKLTNSPDLILSILSPVLGRLIRKGITQQFQQLRESIDNQVRSTFSKEGILGRIKAKFFGVKDGDIIISQASEFGAEIKEVYVLQRHSGLLMGSFSTGSGMDRDMIGGMLTAIKSFVEDAIKAEEDDVVGDELEMIQYGVYKIYIQNFFNYYIAVVMVGSITTADKDLLSVRLNEFAENKIKVVPDIINGEYVNGLSTSLENHFKQNKHDK